MTAPLRTWTAEVVVMDFGAWEPEVPAEAARLIAVVNANRAHAAPKPFTTVARLGPSYRTWVLHFELGEDTDRLSPGEHLVRCEFPSGRVTWAGMPADMLADLDPAAPPIYRNWAEMVASAQS